MPPAVPPPAAGGWQRFVLPATVGVAAVALIAVFATRRQATPASSATPVAQATQAPTKVDSVKVTVGGALPPATTITVDGEVVTPPTFAVTAGTHKFRAAAPGYAAAVESLTVVSGQNLVWTPTITRTAPAAAPHRVAASGAAPPDRPSVSATHPVVAPPVSPVSRNDSTLAALPTTTSSPSCASLFSTLEWDRALPVCQKEAAAGNVASERTLGTLLDRGLGTQANPKLAAIWYQKASDAGDRLAEYQLGVLYRDGKGVKTDSKKAVDLFRKSAAQGDADALSALGTAYERGDGVKRDYTQAADWYRQAAEQGHPGAAYRLGVLYEQGKGVAKSDSAAVAWWARAAAGGEPAARAALAKRTTN
jgi:TPR repeat protein